MPGITIILTILMNLILTICLSKLVGSIYDKSPVPFKKSYTGKFLSLILPCISCTSFYTGLIITGDLKMSALYWMVVYIMDNHTNMFKTKL